MGAGRHIRHLQAFCLETALLFALLDARTALTCHWCLTPPLPPEPLIPGKFWRALVEVLGASEMFCSNLSATFETLLVLGSAGLIGHAILLLSGGRGSGPPSRSPRTP